ncbi:MAG: DUF2141 domain-containing protein [Deltaproteobacteria bacterium]|nr:DUF2141 domain-containing protein [Deltaproteobacteria bacterium]
MFKKVMLFLVTLLVMSAFAYAEDKFTISGEVIFSGDEDIYVSLLTYEAYKNYKKERPPAPFTQIFKANPERKKTGRTPFKFVGVIKGSYFIISFIDENKNGKMDYDRWWFAEEPEISYKDVMFPGWYDVKFEVNKDITGIELKYFE